MRPLVLALTLSLTLTLAVPAASAASCGSVTQPHPNVNGEYAEPVLVGPTHYEVRWWKETNGVEGLQKVSCTAADGTTVAADARDATTKVDLSGLVGFEGGCVIVAGMYICLF